MVSDERKFTLYCYGKKVQEVKMVYNEESAKEYLLRLMDENGEIDGDVLLKKLKKEHPELLS